MTSDGPTPIGTKRWVLLGYSSMDRQDPVGASLLDNFPTWPDAESVMETPKAVPANGMGLYEVAELGDGLIVALRRIAHWPPGGGTRLPLPHTSKERHPSRSPGGNYRHLSLITSNSQEEDR